MTESIYFDPPRQCAECGIPLVKAGKDIRTPTGHRKLGSNGCCTTCDRAAKSAARAQQRRKAGSHAVRLRDVEPADVRKAVMCVARNARDNAEARDVLTMLGITRDHLEATA